MEGAAMTYGLDVDQFRLLVVRPALVRISLWSQAAENLVLGTALQESHLIFLKQIGCGTALGLFQMEPSTHADIWGNFLSHPDRKELMKPVSRLASFFSSDRPDPGEMTFNHQYAAAMCRVHYARIADPLPHQGDPLSLARYYKVHFNTSRGKATIEQALPHFYRAIQQEQAA
jgi:hypothetical protein